MAWAPPKGAGGRGVGRQAWPKICRAQDKNTNRGMQYMFVRYWKVTKQTKELVNKIVSFSYLVKLWFYVTERDKISRKTI